MPGCSSPQRLRRVGVLLAGLLGLACGGAPVPERIVLVTIDTLRADHVGCYGSSWVATPTLDGIAAEGVRFETAIAPTPLTLPSHSSLMTGLAPPHHGARNNSTFRLDEDVPVLAERLHAAGWATAAFVGAVVLDRQYGLARGFDIYDDHMAPRRSAGRFGFSERTANQVVDAALAWLRVAPERFFLWLHLYDPHGSYRPPREYQARFPTHPYAGEIAFADAELGRLLRAVRSRGDPERTLVVVTSDHGESLGEHGELSHSLTLYDATQRIPLLLAGAGLPRGRVVESLVRLLDVAPTILALARLDPLPGIDGRDLRETLNGARAPERLAYLETLSPQLDFGWSPLLGVRSGSFKYIRAPRPELYDLVADAQEAHDLAAQRPEVVAELDAALDAFLRGARPVVSTLAPDSEMRGRLEALGYVVGGAAAVQGELGRVGGFDPKDGLGLAQALLDAIGLVAEDRPHDALALLEPLEGGGFLLELHRAEVALRAGKPALAERSARAALALVPQSTGAHVALGEALLDAGRLDEAARAFQTAQELDEAAADSLVGLGRVAEARGRLDEAAALYARATERRGASPEALWRLAALRIEAGEPAGPLLGQLAEEMVLRPEAALRLAAAEIRAGRRSRAELLLSRALDRTPASAELRRAYEDLRGSRP